MTNNYVNNNQITYSLRILLVDDSVHDYYAFKRAFDKSCVACEITHYCEAEKALQRLMADAASFDLLVTDYQLPGMNGLELCKELIRLDIPLTMVVLTGSGSENLAVEALLAGVDDYLIKDPQQGYFELLPVVLPEAIRKHSDRLVRKLMEEQLKTSEERLELALEATSDGLWDLDIPSGQAYFSPRYYTMIGYEPDEFQQSYETWTEMLHPDDRDAVIYQVGQFFEQKDKAFEIEFRMRTKEGKWRWILSRGKVVQWHNDGSPIRVVGTHTDITQRKQIQEERERLIAGIEAKNKELQHFNSVIRHDFGNPLLSIQAFTQELLSSSHEFQKLLEAEKIEKTTRDRLVSILNDDVLTDIGFIQSAVEEMSKLLEGLKQLAAVGHIVINTESIDMNRAIKQIKGAMRFQIEDSGATMSVDHLPGCFGDLYQIKQVFINILTNAIKYLDPNRKGRIHISGSTKENMSVYCVEDNGIGISQDQQNKVLDIFYRVGAKQNVEGEGLGLSIAIKILERLDGIIWLESEEGKGSKFYVALPADVAVAAEGVE